MIQTVFSKQEKWELIYNIVTGQFQCRSGQVWSALRGRVCRWAGGLRWMLNEDYGSVWQGERNREKEKKYHGERVIVNYIRISESIFNLT